LIGVRSPHSYISNDNYTPLFAAKPRINYPALSVDTPQQRNPDFLIVSNSNKLALTPVAGGEQNSR
jgi:hypothetical protein